MIVMVTMSYKTINVTSKTYEKLVLYKHGNMSFDDVINGFMSQIEEKKFYNHVLKEHKKRMQKIKAGDCVESDSIDDALKNAWGNFLELNKKSSNYRIFQGKDFLKDVKKNLKSGDKSLLSDIQKVIDKSKIDPHKKRPKMDIKLISPKKESIYRVRLGKYRLVYEIDETNKTVILTMFFIRGRGYQ